MSEADAVITQEPAATPEQVAPAPEATEHQASENQTPAAKTLTQDEVNAIVQKEKAKAEAKAERRFLRALERVIPRQQQEQPAKETAPGRPARDQFASQEAYEDALVDWRIEQRDAQSREERAYEQQRTLVDRTEKLYAQAAKLDGFDRHEFDALPLTQAISSAVIESDVAAQLMAAMTQDPEEVQRIANLPPARQAAEIGKWEARLEAAPPPPKPSKLPAPIAPVGTNKGASDKDPSEMSQSEFNKWRKSQIAKR